MKLHHVLMNYANLVERLKKQDHNCSIDKQHFLKKSGSKKRRSKARIRV
jgi:hypothetical protein